MATPKNNVPKHAQQDYRSDLDMWQAMWDEAEKGGVHPPVESPKPAIAPGTGKAQDIYYDYIADQARDEVLQEMKIPNPVYPDSAGPDSDPKPRTAWANEDLLKEVEKLKKQMFNLENKMAQLGSGKKWPEKPITQGGGDRDKKLMSEIESIRKKLESVSSLLGIKNEPSPWEIKRD